MEATDLFRQAMILIVTLSMPALVAAVVLGIVISLVQSLFQIQDQTLAFAIKLVAVSAILYLTGGWMESQIVQLTDHAFRVMSLTGLH